MTPIQTPGEGIEVALPWPDRALSPNGRAHWATKARATKTAKTMAAALTRMESKGKLSWARVHLHWTFHPKTANAVDADNCIASCKAYQDGIALGIGIDDQHFSATYGFGSPIKDGAVLVTISEAK